MSTFPELWTLARSLRQDYRWVDLTHSFHAGQPHFGALPDETRERLYTVEEHGFEIDRYSIVGQWGTHVDPPVHFVTGARPLDEIPVEQMVLPLVVIDVHEQAAADADYSPTVEDILEWEKRHRPIPEGSFVALRTDWSQRWPDATAMNNADEEGINHYPAWNPTVVEWLITERNITALGHETTDTDLGARVSRGELPSELLLLQHDRWQIEMLCNLNQVPEVGALIVASWPKPLHGTGFPARAFAIVPEPAAR
ncbi:cyclase family protein [Corynebacterium sp. TAE3-ERU2]|uniref:cyclase family protein n=1 Tax=Corynebacterium sp. TAE3-ERU2 TaxID=2849497 RepID=UPI001C46BA26|nr:cyclase family protein [Corynebacterium sp. TAE3-ERU2]MBV7302558.1 cyclase family protein [Corynebacterium sp. TAE3-ERU2]